MSVEKKTINIFWGGKKPFDLLEQLPKKKWQLLGATPCNWASPLSHAPPFCWSRLETPKNLCSKSKRRPSGSLMQFGLSPVNLTHPLLPIERVLSKLACALSSAHLSNGNPANICENCGFCCHLQWILECLVRTLNSIRFPLLRV